MRSTSALALSLAASIVCILSLGSCEEALAWDEGSFIRSEKFQTNSSFIIAPTITTATKTTL